MIAPACPACHGALTVPPLTPDSENEETFVPTRAEVGGWYLPSVTGLPVNAVTVTIKLMATNAPIPKDTSIMGDGPRRELVVSDKDIDRHRDKERGEIGN